MHIIKCPVCVDSLFWRYTDEVADRFATCILDLEERLNIAVSEDDWMEEECTSYAIDEIRKLRDSLDAIKAEGSTLLQGETAEGTESQMSFMFSED